MGGNIYTTVVVSGKANAPGVCVEQEANRKSTRGKQEAYGASEAASSHRDGIPPS